MTPLTTAEVSAINIDITLIFTCYVHLLINVRKVKSHREDFIDRLVRTFYPTTADKRHVRQIAIFHDTTPFSRPQKIFLGARSVKVPCHLCRVTFISFKRFLISYRK